LAVPNILRTFADAYKEDCNQSVRANVIAYGFVAAGFFYAHSYHFPDIGKKVYILYGGCMNRKDLKCPFRMSHLLYKQRGMQPPPFYKIGCQMLIKKMHYAEFNYHE